MSRLFTVKDVTQREIYLTRERWAHIQKHQGMGSQLPSIIETLQRPNHIIESFHDENKRHYFRYFKQERAYLFISVKYLNGEGYIITSFYTDKMKGKLKIYYDEEGDFLEISVGEMKKGIFRNLGDGIFECVDELTKEVVAIAIHDFRKRMEVGKEIALPIDAQLIARMVARV